MSKKGFINYVVCCMAILCINGLSAQNTIASKVDSLQTFIEKAPNDTLKVIAYQDLAKLLLRQGKAQEMLTIADEGIALSEKLNYSRGEAQMKLTKGVVFYATGKCDEAIELYDQALKIAKEIEEKELEAKIHINTGSCYQKKGDLDLALESYLNAYALKQSLQKPHLAALLNNIGAIYRIKERYERAEEIYLSSYEIKKEVNDSLGMATSLMNLGLVYYLMKGKESLAIETLNKSKLFYQNLGREDEVATCHTALGRVYSGLGDITQAKEELNNAWSYFKDQPISDYYCHTLSLLGEVALVENKLIDAEEYLTEARRAAIKLERKQEKADILLGLSRAKYGLGKESEAYDLIESVLALKDTLNQESRLKSMEEMQAKFDVRQKESELEISNLKLDQRTKQRNIFLVAATGFFLFAGMIFLFLRHRIRANNKIAIQTELIHAQEITELEQQNKLLALNSMIEGQEAERMRIAKDLHDSLGGLLSTVKAHFTAIQNENDEQEKSSITTKTNTLIDEACVEVRRISHNMIPHALTISGLPVALEDMAANLRREGYEVDLSILDFPKQMAKTKQAMLYRLLQEIIANIRKHAQAKSILIQLFKTNGSLSLIVEDDGKGFNYTVAVASGGVGLKSINSRVEFLNGEIDWDSSVGAGTTITITIPEIL